jgi:serine/threonine protein kinase
VLTAGSRLGPYEILGPLGTGGMGEVYRARDTSLKREVALKVLPDAFAQDPDRLARFQREAELLATLNHPNIAAVYGLEKTDGVIAIVMELVEGETLEEKIRRPQPSRGLALDEALAIARQVADALEAAHERSVIHRDLKPANIKITADGKVKVLDFGLAKLGERSASLSGDRGDISASPTLTTPARLRQGFGEAGTEPGMILGTAAYMAPEQAKGRPVDKRADIWAFGVVF